MKLNFEKIEDIYILIPTIIIQNDFKGISIGWWMWTLTIGTG